MCFSAKASFAAAGALSIIGLASVKQVRTKKLIPFALSPLFFALQQLSEGFVWITLMHGDTTSIMHWASVYTFLFFAAMFWPLWVPFSLYCIETIRTRKQILSVFIWCGVGIALILLLYWIVRVKQAIIINHHINYPIAYYPFGIDQKYSVVGAYILSLLYGIIIVAPFFISTLPYSKLLGFIIGMGALIAYIFYLVAFASVWCFFAAICSGMIYFIVRNYEKN